MTTSFRASVWLALKRAILCLGIVGALHAAATTQAMASAACTAVANSVATGGFNFSNAAFDPGNSSILTAWAAGDRITVNFTDAVGITHTDGVYHGPDLASIGALQTVSVPSGGSAGFTYTVTPADLTGGILLDPENNDTVVASCAPAAATSTTLGSSVNPSVFGQTVLFTATVTSGAGTPTGSVTFMDGATPLGTVSLVGGSASLSTSALSVASHSITATFNSGPGFGVSTSNTVTQVVNKASTTTAVTGSPNPSVFGQSVTLTATVSAAAPGSGTPTGNVTFKDGVSTLGTVALAGGTATLTTSALTIGSHSITVAYAGDANFGISTSSALSQVVAVANAYVLPKGGFDAAVCALTTPCATLNFALSVIGAGGQVTIIGGGLFGPVVLTKEVSVVGFDPKVTFQIAADSTAAVGCVGGAPGTCSVNNGYGVEIATAAADTVKVTNAVVTAGLSGAGALKLTSGGVVQLSNNVYRGNASATGPIVSLYPNNPGTTQVQVYFTDSDIGFNNNSANAGAVEVKPSGNTSLKLQFNRVEVHNASYGIRTDASLLSGPSASVTTSIAASEFFSFANAAVNAFSSAGTGKTNAVFDDVNVLNASVGIKSNGPQSVVILTNSTISGNAIGVQTQNSGIVYTSTNNTIFGNGADLSGALTTAPKR